MTKETEDIRHQDSIYINESELKHKMVSQHQIPHGRHSFRDCICKSRDYQLVQNSGDVSFAVFSYVRRDWKCCSYRNDFRLGHQKI